MNILRIWLCNYFSLSLLTEHSKYMKILLIISILLFASCAKNIGESEKTIDGNEKGKVLNIPLSGSLQNPAFSPDSRSIVFTRFINGYNREPAEMYKFNLYTEQLTLLVSDGSANVNLPGSCWNGAIGKITFSSSRDTHDEIYLIRETGTTGDEYRITNRPAAAGYEPTLSPDGKWIVFESHKVDEEENGIIVKYKTEGSSSYINLTSADADCRQPNWSPAGDKILFQKFEDKQWDIWIMNTDGSGKKRITFGQGDKTDASFSNDGQYIVYSCDFESDLADIYRISVSGGEPVRLTGLAGYEGAPSVSPDGAKLVCESCKGEPDNSGGTKLIIFEY